jgi:hypothetical protein
MAQCYMRLPLHSLAVQEATQWDIRALHEPFGVVVLLISLILLLVPVVQLLRRTGHHAVWCILALFPVLNVIAFWFFAFKPWPSDKKSGSIGN